MICFGYTYSDDNTAYNLTVPVSYGIDATIEDQWDMVTSSSGTPTEFEQDWVLAL